MSETKGQYEASSYYQSFAERDIRHGFYDLDEPANLDRLMVAARSSLTRNFVLDFNDEAAFVAFDLSAQSIGTLLDAVPQVPLNVRWINIWYPYLQIPLLDLLAKRYDFSPRLLALMSSDPRSPRRSPTASHIRHKGLRRHWKHGYSWNRQAQAKATSFDIELEGGLDELTEHSSLSSMNSAMRGNFFRLVDDLWHYTSVDYGRGFICAGYNSLYGSKSPWDKDDHVELKKPLPFCTRVWTWLLITDDNTIITVNEDPFPFQEGMLDDLQQQRILAETRRNLVNVFRSLSRVEEDTLMVQYPMTLLPIRTRLGDSPEETVHRQSDAPGLLFYYLFENWYNSYTLVTRKESRYGVELDKLRAELFRCPELRHIDRLDGIGKELGVLRRHYQSYNRIIDRLLERHTPTMASLQNSQVASEASQTSLDTVKPRMTEKESTMGVSLSSAARVRFRRLKDVIDLYALSEVDEYIKQKDALIAINFNLIAMKQSADTERLTRVTLLITKATILFLPVSLLSAYFAINLEGVEYTVKEYWVSFAVVLCSSWLAMFVLGVFSDSVQSVTFFRGVWDAWKQLRLWFARLV